MPGKSISPLADASPKHKKPRGRKARGGRRDQPSFGRIAQTTPFNYHMRNIYSKLGVHSRQELLVSIYNQQKQQKQ